MYTYRLIQTFKYIILFYLKRSIILIQNNYIDLDNSDKRTQLSLLVNLFNDSVPHMINYCSYIEDNNIWNACKTVIDCVCDYNKNKFVKRNIVCAHCSWQKKIMI